MRRAPDIKLSETERAELAEWSRSRTLPARQVSAGRILLLAADGQPDIAIAEAVGCGRRRCARVRQHFLGGGLERLRRDAPRSGRPIEHDAQHILTLTTTTTPAQATDWSRTLMAQAAGVSASTVGRDLASAWAEAAPRGDLQSQQRSAVCREARGHCRAVSGAAGRALVLCVDEKSQIQALDRTQPGLPLQQGRAAHHDPRLQAPWHDHAVCGVEHARWQSHRHVPAAAPPSGVPAFLEQIDARDAPRAGAAPHRRQLRHAQAPQVKAWLKRHPRFHLHFTPTSASWLNMVERFSAT